MELRVAGEEAEEPLPGDPDEGGVGEGRGVHGVVPPLQHGHEGEGFAGPDHLHDVLPALGTGAGELHPARGGDEEGLGGLPRAEDAVPLAGGPEPALHHEGGELVAAHPLEEGVGLQGVEDACHGPRL